MLRRGGRVALAVWDSIERNPWAALPALELRRARARAAPAAPGRAAPGPFALGDAERLRGMLDGRGLHRDVDRGDRPAAPARELRGVLGDHARPLAGVPRRRARRAPQEEIDAIKHGPRAALRAATPRATARSTFPGRTLVASAEARRARASRIACAPMIYDDDADLAPARRQDRRDHRLRLPGPRARAQPQGLRRRRRRRPARDSSSVAAGARAGPRGAAGRRGRQPRRPRDDARPRRAPPRGLGERGPRRHRRGQHAAVRPRLLDPLRRGRAARRRRRRAGRAEGPRPPRAPPVHRGHRRPRA